MNYIKARYSKRHTTGLSVWNLDELGIAPAEIKDYNIKWDKLTIYFKDEERDAEDFFPTGPEVESFDNVNGHEWVKYPMSIKANFKMEAAE